jgi:hypothetical protein
MYSRYLKFEIEDWERLIFNSHKDKFIKEFLYDENSPGIICLLSVHWNSCSMVVSYVLDNSKHVTTNFSIYLWIDFYNEYKDKENKS